MDMNRLNWNWNPLAIPTLCLHQHSQDNVIARLEAIMNEPISNYPHTTHIPYQNEISCLESALSFLTRTNIPPGAITLDPLNNNTVVETGLY